MAIAIRQHVTGTVTSPTNTNQVTVTLTALAAGSLVVVGVHGTSNEGATSISDGGNSYAAVNSAKATEAGGRSADTWWAHNVTGGSTSLTVTFSATSTNRKSIEVYEVTGLGSDQAVDAANANTGSSTAGSFTDTGAAVTTTDANTFIAANIRTAGGQITQDSGDTIFAVDDNMGGGGCSSSTIRSATGTYTPVWHDQSGAGFAFASSVVAFKALGVVPPQNPQAVLERPFNMGTGRWF